MCCATVPAGGGLRGSLLDQWIMHPLCRGSQWRGRECPGSRSLLPGSRLRAQRSALDSQRGGVGLELLSEPAPGSLRVLREEHMNPGRGLGLSWELFALERGQLGRRRESLMRADDMRNATCSPPPRAPALLSEDSLPPGPRWHSQGHRPEGPASGPPQPSHHSVQKY